MRCLKCGLEELTAGTARCPACNANIASLLYDVLPAGRELHQGKYQIDYPLGKGGFGITYKAFLGATGGAVAIKEYCPQGIAPRDPETGHITVSIHDLPNFERGLAIFRREAQILENVTHPNVVRIRDFFDENNTAYLVMEFLNGPTLRNIMREALPSETRIREILGSLVSALATLHEKGIYHLDIKPGNVILEPERGAVLVDFGAARQGTTLSELSSLPQTKAYAPLEMIRPERGMGDAYGPETDLYELGVTLYEMLTGKLPPPADARAVGQQWDLSDLPEPWQTLIREATRVERTERPRDIRAWWSLAERGSTLEGPSSLPETGRWAQTLTERSSRASDFPSGPVPSVDRPSQNSGNVPSDPPSQDSLSREAALAAAQPHHDRRLPVPAMVALGLGTACVVGFVLLLNPGSKPAESTAPSPAVAATMTPAANSVPTPTPEAGPSEAERQEATNDLRKTLTAFGKPPEGDTAFGLFMDKLVAEAELALEKGADVKVAGDKGATVLHLATYKDNAEFAKRCIDRGADPNAKDADGYTPLHMAALAPAPKVAQILVDGGGDTTLKTSGGETALQLAQKAQTEETNAQYKTQREGVIQLLVRSQVSGLRAQ